MRVLWADDHYRQLTPVQTLLERRFELVGMVSDGKAALDAARKLRPDVVVLDISMPELSGIDVARKLQADEDGPAIVFLSVHQDPAIVGAALDAGAFGYVLKAVAGRDLIVAIEEALAGRRYLSPALRTPP